MHEEGRPRIDPLPEEEWDDETRALVELNWSGPPPGNRNNLYRTMVRHPDLYRTCTNSAGSRSMAGSMRATASS